MVNLEWQKQMRPKSIVNNTYATSLFLFNCVKTQLYTEKIVFVRISVDKQTSNIIK